MNGEQRRAGEERWRARPVQRMPGRPAPRHHQHRRAPRWRSAAPRRTSCAFVPRAVDDSPSRVRGTTSTHSVASGRCATTKRRAPFSCRAHRRGRSSSRASRRPDPSSERRFGAFAMRSKACTVNARRRHASGDVETGGVELIRALAPETRRSSPHQAIGVAVRRRGRACRATRPCSSAQQREHLRAREARIRRELARRRAAPRRRARSRSRADGARMRATSGRGGRRRARRRSWRSRATR